MAYTQILRVTKKEINALPMSRLRQKPSAKATNMRSKNFPEQKVGFILQTESKFSALCFKTSLSCSIFVRKREKDWKLKADVFNERCVIVRSENMVVPHKSQVIAANGEVYTPTVINEEMAIKETMEKELKGE